MKIFNFLSKKKTTGEYTISANPLHDMLFVARCQKFNTDPVSQNCSMMVGDSITAGAETFPDLFPGVYNEGIPGDTTVDLRKRLPLVKKQTPSKIFLLIGTNNLGAWIYTDTTCKRDYPAVTTKLITDYIEILNYFKNELPNTIVYVQSILPVNGVMPGTVTIGRSNIVIQQLNEVLSHSPYLYPNCQYINLYPKFLDSTGTVLDSALTDDGLHPNRKGYAVWAEILKEFLVN